MRRFDWRAQLWLAWILLAVVTIVYSLAMSHQAILRYATFKATAFDLGNMDQVIWNTLHGRLFQFTNQAIDWYGPPTRLAIHFEPIILPLSLLYSFGADPRILLVFQTLALASGSLPVFLLTRKIIPQWPLLAALMATAYLLAPALIGLNIFDFHPIALATPLLLYALLALEYKHYAWFLIACVLAACTKEDVPLAIAMLGILVIWKYKLPRLGLTLLIGGALWSLIAFRIIIPHFYPGVQANNFWYRYEELGSSPGAAILNLFVRPWVFFSLFFTLDRLYYLLSLVRGAGFLSLLAPEWLLPILPSLAVNLLSTDPLLYSGVYHYNAAIIPFVMIAAIHGTRRLLALWEGWSVGTPIVGVRGGDVGGTRAAQAPAKSLAPRYRLSTSGDVGGTRAAQGGTRAAQAPPPIITTSPAPTTTFGWRASWGGRGWEGWWGRFAHLKARLWRMTLPRWREAQRQRFSKRMQPLARATSPARLQWTTFAWITIMLGLNLVLMVGALSSFWADHDPGSREQHINQVLAMIPPDASVSASDDLNPHLSERRFVTVFPTICLDSRCNQMVQYVVVDLNNLTLANRAEASSKLNSLQRQFRILAQAEGIVLLVRRST
jgi:uncharacterized membrane protein